MSHKILVTAMVFLFVGAFLFARGEGERGGGPHIYVDDVDLGPAADWQEEEGLLILQVMEDSPAQEAGLVRGDILLAVDGEQVAAAADVRDILAGHRAGDTITLNIRHGDEEKDVELTIEDRLYRSPLGLALAAPGTGGPRFGFDPNHLESPIPIPLLEDGMFVVREVVDEGPAESAGLRKGDVILGIEGEELSAHDSLVDIVRSREPGDEIELTIKRYEDGELEELKISVVLGEDDDGNTLLGIHYMPLPLRFGFSFGLPEDLKRFRFSPRMTPMPRGGGRRGWIGTVEGLPFTEPRDI